MATAGLDDPVALRRRLRVTVAVLVVVVVGIALAGRSYDTWPVSAWPVYSRTRAAVPGPETSELQVRAVTVDGAVHRFRSDQLVEFSRAQIADDAIAASVDDAEVRRYLVHVVEASVDGELAQVEVWEQTWAVDAEQVPPIDRDDPVAEHRLVAFLPDGSAVDGTALPRGDGAGVPR